jgi:hypothetical protein
MAPHGLGRMSAKDLILKDADYSTPSDHYFAYLQKMKQPDVVKETLEDKVIEDLNIDKSSLKQLLVEEEVKPKLTALQQFDILTPDQKLHLAKESGLKSAEQIRLLLAIPEETFETKRSVKDSKILNDLTVKSIIDMPFTHTRTAKFEE